MKLWMAFLAGFIVGTLCMGEKAKETGYKAGVWTREFLGLSKTD